MVEVAFTIKELRELLNLPGTSSLIDLDGPVPGISALPRPRRRISELLVASAIAKPVVRDRHWRLLFNRSPIEVHLILLYPFLRSSPTTTNKYEPFA